MAKFLTYIALGALVANAFIPRRFRWASMGIAIVALGIMVFAVDTPAIPLWVKAPIWLAVSALYIWRAWRKEPVRSIGVN